MNLLAQGLDILAHQRGEDLFSFRCVFEAHLEVAIRLWLVTPDCSH